MTNAQIILNESFNLMEKGILKGSGTYGTMIDENGKEEDKTSMFLKMSAFFTAEQVEKIKA